MEAVKKKVVSTSAEAKKFVVLIIRMINNNERAFFAKFMEDFRELNGKHQEGLLRYLSERCDQKKWKDRLDDTTMYNDVIRSVLFHYSGRDELGQPSKKEFAHALREYIDSAEFKAVEDGDHEIFGTALGII